jgi:hypothetical protein
MEDDFRRQDKTGFFILQPLPVEKGLLNPLAGECCRHDADVKELWRCASHYSRAAVRPQGILITGVSRSNGLLSAIESNHNAMPRFDQSIADCSPLAIWVDNAS